MVRINAIVITYNEAANIKECLESLNWCDEIIVVDSGSNDNTCEIAMEYTNNITISGNKPYGEKRNIGIERATADWIIWLDADERISPNLKNEIISLINSTDEELDAYYINRKSFFINKFIKHCGWYPDYTLRLFKKSTNIRFNDALVHEKAVYSGSIGKLKNDILHYTDRNFEHYIDKLNNYTSLSAEELSKKGPTGASASHAGAGESPTGGKLAARFGSPGPLRRTCVSFTHLSFEAVIAMNVPDGS